MLFRLADMPFPTETTQVNSFPLTLEDSDSDPSGGPSLTLHLPPSSPWLLGLIRFLGEPHQPSSHLPVGAWISRY